MLRESNIVFVFLLSFLHVSKSEEPLNCRYNEWQCKDACINEYRMCHDTCKQWYTKCVPESKCLGPWHICNGKVDCDDGSDEAGCSDNCEVPVRESVAYHIGNGYLVDCNGNKSCAGDPCNEECVRYKQGHHFPLNLFYK